MPGFGLAFILSRLGHGARGASELAKRANLLLPLPHRAAPALKAAREEPPTPPGHLGGTICGAQNIPELRVN
eukprot:Skav211745  [mRNA]  locus=scaffold1548:345566:345781:+ [translate_table: standard]